MAKGKIIYTPMTFHCLIFDEAHYVSIDNSAFNFSTIDFSLDALLAVDSTVADAESWIAAKGASSLTSAAGWHWYYTKADRKLNLRINDGDVSPTVISSISNAFEFNTRFWARVTVDRDGLATHYVNGVNVGQASVTAANGSVNNTQYLKLGAYDASTNNHKGYIDFFRVDSGRILGTSWMSAEYDRIRYGYPRTIQDFTAMWTFGETLYDLSANAYLLAINTGSPVYAAGWPTSISYTFSRNFNIGHSHNFLQTDDLQRSLDGTMYVYAGPRKQQINLDFQLTSDLQKDIFKSIAASGYAFDIYLDADLPKTMTAYLTTPPEITSLGAGYWQVSLELAET